MSQDREAQLADAYHQVGGQATAQCPEGHDDAFNQVLVPALSSEYLQSLEEEEEEKMERSGKAKYRHRSISG